MFSVSFAIFTNILLLVCMLMAGELSLTMCTLFNVSLHFDVLYNLNDPLFVLPVSIYSTLVCSEFTTICPSLIVKVIPLTEAGLAVTEFSLNVITIGVSKV